MPSVKRPSGPYARPLPPRRATTSPTIKTPNVDLLQTRVPAPEPETPANDEAFWPFEPFDTEKLGPNLFQTATLTPDEEARIEAILAEIDAEAERGRVARAAKRAARRAAKLH